MDARLFDMLHDARDMDVLAVTKRVDINLDRARKIAVKKDRVLAGNLNGLADVAFQLRVVADDLHRAAAQHEGGADHERVADFGGDGKSLIARAGGAVMRLLEVQRVQKLLEAFAVFGQINRVRRGAKDRDAFFVKRIGEFQRGLAAELHDDAVQGAVFLFDPEDFKHMLQRQGFKIQAVRSVVIGGHGFGVAVDHDGFIAGLGQRVAGVAAAIVKLDPLTDAVGAAAKNHDFLGV